MNPFRERTLVITVRCPDGLEKPGVWLTLYDDHEVAGAALLSVRGELTLEDLPFSAGDALGELLFTESARYPRLV